MESSRPAPAREEGLWHTLTEQGESERGWCKVMLNYSLQNSEERGQKATERMSVREGPKIKK